MKQLRYLLFPLTALLLASCLDTEETITLNADDSGTYSLSYDMGRLLDLAKSMGGEKPSSDKTKEKQDTTLFFKDLLKEADVLTPEEKLLFADAQITIKVDEANNKMNIMMRAPFKNSAGLTALKKQFPEVLAKLKAFEKATGDLAPGGDEESDVKMDAKSTNPLGDQFTFLARPGAISNTLGDMSAFKAAIAADSSLTMMTQMTALMGDFNYKTIILLPKAVKDFKGPGSSVSSDKKTVTFVTNLTEMMEQPDKASYSITY